MNISRHGRNLIAFESLQAGDVFEYGERFFLKIDTRTKNCTEPININAVNLSEGSTLVCFDTMTKVFLRDATLTINY